MSPHTNTRSGLDVSGELGDLATQIRLPDGAIVRPGDLVWPAPHTVQGVPAGAVGRVVGRIERHPYPGALVVIAWSSDRLIPVRIGPDKTRMHSIPVGTLAMRASELVSDPANRLKVGLQ